MFEKAAFGHGEYRRIIENRFDTNGVEAVFFDLGDCLFDGGLGGRGGGTQPDTSLFYGNFRDNKIFESRGFFFEGVFVRGEVLNIVGRGEGLGAGRDFLAFSKSFSQFSIVSLKEEATDSLS